MADLILNNDGIVNRVSSYYLSAAQRNGAIDFEDLRQSALLGLLLAVDRWNEDAGSFLTIAVFYMRSEIRKLLRINTSKDRIENAASIVSLSEPVVKDGETQLVETIADENATDPCEAACRDDLRQTVRKEVDALPPECREAIIQHYFMGIPLCKIDKKARDKALKILHRRSLIMNLVTRYEDPLYQFGGLRGFKHSFESCVERAVIRREETLGRARRLFDTKGKKYCG